MDFAHGLLMGVFGCFKQSKEHNCDLVVNHNIRLEKRRKVKDTGFNG